MEIFNFTGILLLVPVTQDFEVGPIWNDEDAPGKADAWLRKNPGWAWTGNWHTTIPGEMSVIQVVPTEGNFFFSQ